MNALSGWPDVLPGRIRMATGSLHAPDVAIGCVGLQLAESADVKLVPGEENDVVVRVPPSGA
ncbi:hypothetical protein [Mycolicibacterium llatzerense]|uniref:hypothetical protein n=1 Tax=Mycolicibacterium llatzerense TaxID=280871 RepID=UPI0008DCD281|nr:hypothetical protein [Mycolicibacterium llatzerense]